MMLITMMVQPAKAWLRRMSARPRSARSLDLPLTLHNASEILHSSICSNSGASRTQSCGARQLSTNSMPWIEPCLCESCPSEIAPFCWWKNDNGWVDGWMGGWMEKWMDGMFRLGMILAILNPYYILRRRSLVCHIGQC